MWRLRIWFMDNVWDKIFPADETQKCIMAPGVFKMYRMKLGLSEKGMAEMLKVPIKSIKNWEHHGIFGPSDDGCAALLIKILVKAIEDAEEIKQICGYKGPR